jgi:hypothetical protein
MRQPMSATCNCYRFSSFLKTVERGAFGQVFERSAIALRLTVGCWDQGVAMTSLTQNVSVHSHERVSP